MNTHKIGRFRAGILVAAVTASMLFPSAIANADELADPATVAVEAAATATEAEELPTPEPVAEPAPQADPEPAPQPEPEGAPDPALTGPTDEDADAPAVEEEPGSVPDPDAEEQRSDESSEKDGEAASLRKSEDDSPSPTLAALIPERAVTGTVRGANGTVATGGAIYLQNSNVSKSANIGFDGSFHFDPLPVGSYVVFVYTPGFLPFAGQLVITPGNGSQSHDPVVAIASSMSGRVTDELTGDPIAEVTVFARYANGEETSVRTAADGTWAIDQLQPGTVTLQFVPAPGSPYYVAWYPGRGSQSSATTLELLPSGSTLTGLNNTLNNTAARIGGSVLENYNPAQGAWVKIIDHEGSLVGQVEVNDPNGSWISTGLRSGTYRVWAERGTLRSAEQTVTLGGDGGETDVLNVIHFLDRPLNTPLPAPIAVNDSFTTPADTLLQVGAPGLLSNDIPSKPAGNELHLYEVTTQPQHGDLIVSGDGSFVYMPDAGFTGTDKFKYSVEDYGFAEEPATVTIHVTDEGSVTPLTAVDDAYPTALNAPLTIDSTNGLLSNDTGEGTLRVVGLQGSASANSSFEVATDEGGSVTVSSTGALEYVPAAGFEGVDTFSYLVDDESDAAPATATVRITVGGEVIVCHDPLGNEIPCDQPEVCRDPLGNVIDCEEKPEQPEVCRDPFGNETDCEDESEPEQPERDRPRTDTSSTTETLAQTGSNANAMIWVAGIAGFLLIDGIVLLVFMRRRVLRASANTDIDAA